MDDLSVSRQKERSLGAADEGIAGGAGVVDRQQIGSTWQEEARNDANGGADPGRAGFASAPRCLEVNVEVLDDGLDVLLLACDRDRRAGVDRPVTVALGLGEKCGRIQNAIAQLTEVHVLVFWVVCDVSVFRFDVSVRALVAKLAVAFLE